MKLRDEISKHMKVECEEKVWKIIWDGGNETILIGDTIHNALEKQGYRPEVMKHIKNWELLVREK